LEMSEKNINFALSSYGREILDYQIKKVKKNLHNSK
jgi:hypothetical protein